MSRSTVHDLQPRTDHDGMSRRLAVLACKTVVRSTLQAALKRDVDAAAMPERVKTADAYRLWSGVSRASQDRMWRVLSEQVDADYSRIDDRARSAAAESPGSLDLDMPTSVPAYQTRTHIHGQTGGYMLERGSDDLAPGILYEAGGNLYALGQGIGKRDSKGERLIAHVRERFPDLHPKRILEMGCSAGGQSTDYPAAFPDAEVHAIDLSPGMLRYAHARAALLNRAVHFHQRDAGDTGFEDDSFELIVSHNLFHEVAAEHMPAILRECFRLLRPGGVCIHQDVPIQTRRLDAFTRFLSEWQTENNDEPFWLDFAEADLSAMAVDAGFDRARVSTEYLRAIDGPIPWYVMTAIK